MTDAQQERDRYRKAWRESGLSSELVVIPEWGDIKIEMRSRTVGEQSELFRISRRPDGSTDQDLLAIETIIACAYIPGSDVRMWESADRDEFKTKDARGFNRALAAANKAAGLESEEEVVADLDATQPSDPSTS